MGILDISWLTSGVWYWGVILCGQYIIRRARVQKYRRVILYLGIIYNEKYGDCPMPRSVIIGSIIDKYDCTTWMPLCWENTANKDNFPASSSVIGVWGCNLGSHFILMYGSYEMKDKEVLLEVQLYQWPRNTTASMSLTCEYCEIGQGSWLVMWWIKITNILCKWHIRMNVDQTEKEVYTMNFYLPCLPLSCEIN